MYKKEFYPQPIYREKASKSSIRFCLTDSILGVKRLKEVKEGISYITKVHKSVGFGSSRYRWFIHQNSEFLKSSSTSSLSSISSHLAQRHPEETPVADAHLRCTQLLEVITEVVTVDTLHGRG